jgi:hypothetical protein
MGSEIVPETACLQVVGAPSGVTAYFLHNGPASYSSVARLSDERSRSESESEQGDSVTGGRPETGRAIHGQVEAGVRPRGGPNRPRLKTGRMTCG